MRDAKGRFIKAPTWWEIAGFVVAAGLLLICCAYFVSMHG